jgi:hypothetical protein
MSWTYNQATGEIRYNQTPRGNGYSGYGNAKNWPDREAEPNMGPIPRGEWHIGLPYTHPHLGPVVMNLDPVGHNADGRSLFRIHGDNVTHDASHGCIILPRKIREEIAASRDHQLWVV